MTRSAELKSIDCPSCGAGLQIIGGGRVTTHVCSYCGAMLDAVDNYRVLKKFANMFRPATPFSIGMKGVLKGVEFTIIGIIAEEERYNGRTWTWVDHLLYSPTHGYAWLTVEDGHTIWNRRYRGDVSPGWIAPRDVEAASVPPHAYALGENFKYYETSESRVTFVEGEFTWQPSKDDRSTTVSLLSDRHMLEYTATANEREISISEYLPGPETLAAFGATGRLAPHRVHPLQSYTGGVNDIFLRNTAVVFLVLCLIGAAVTASSGHRILDRTEVTPSGQPTTVQIPVDTPGRLVRLEIRGDVAAGWAWIDFELTDPEDQPVFVAGREVGYYTGYDDGAWTEDDRTTSLRFRPRVAGTYELEVQASEANPLDVSIADPRAKLPVVWVSATDDLGSALWLLVAALGFAAVAAWKGTAPLLFQRARWYGTDWTEDDDDDEDED